MSRRLQFSVIAVFAFVLYSRTLSFDFIGLDEPTLIIDNYPFLKNPSNFTQAFKRHVFYARHHTDNPTDFYRPLLTLSFMLDAQFSNRPNPKISHFSNIIYHVAACILLFILFLRLKIESSIAFFFCLIFAAHPLLSQAVAWVPGRNDSLVTIFCLLSFINLVNYADSGSARSLIFHLGFFFIALLTKESAIALTGISILYLVLIRNQKIITSKSISLFTGYCILTLLWYFMRKQAFEAVSTGSSMKDPLNELLVNAPLMLQYFQKAILPFNLAVTSSVRDTNYVLVAISLFIPALGFYYTKEKKWKSFIFGLTWFVAFTGPSLLSGYFGGLEHRTYLSMAGVFISISGFDIFRPSHANRRRANRYLVLPASILLLFAGITYFRMPVFSNALSYWESAVKTSDNSSLACLNLGKIYETMGRYQDAIVLYREGLKKNPHERLLHNNIGGAYMYMKMYDYAEPELKKEIELFPDNDLAYFNLGLIKKLNGKKEEAVYYWKKALEYNKNFINPCLQLAQYYKSTGDTLQYRIYSERARYAMTN